MTDIIDSEAVPSNGTAIALHQQQGSALAVPGGYDFSNDDFAEFEGFTQKPLRLTFNGKDGGFISSADKDGEIIPVIEGFLGPTWRAQAMFPPRADSPFYPAEKDVWGDAKWICRAPDYAQPPILNDKLAPAALDHARKMGMGKSCATCPMQKWGQDGAKARCTRFLDAIWVDRETGRAGIVSFKTFSIGIVGDYITGFVNKVMREVPYLYVTSISGKREKKDGNTFYVAAPKVASERLEPAQFNATKALIKTMTPQLRHQSREIDVVDAEDVAPAPAQEFGGYEQHGGGFEEPPLDYAGDLQVPF